jgi:hypothetical protein
MATKNLFDPPMLPANPDVPSHDEGTEGEVEFDVFMA